MTADSWLVLAVWGGLMMYALSGTPELKKLTPVYRFLVDLGKWLIDRYRSDKNNKND